MVIGASENKTCQVYARACPPTRAVYLHAPVYVSATNVQESGAARYRDVRTPSGRNRKAAALPLVHIRTGRAAAKVSTGY